MKTWYEKCYGVPPPTCGCSPRPTAEKPKDGPEPKKQTPVESIIRTRQALWDNKSATDFIQKIRSNGKEKIL